MFYCGYTLVVEALFRLYLPEEPLPVPVPTMPVAVSDFFAAVVCTPFSFGAAAAGAGGWVCAFASLAAYGATAGAASMASISGRRV